MYLKEGAGKLWAAQESENKPPFLSIWPRMNDSTAIRGAELLVGSDNNTNNKKYGNFNSDQLQLQLAVSDWIIWKLPECWGLV